MYDRMGINCLEYEVPHESVYAKADFLENIFDRR